MGWTNLGYVPLKRILEEMVARKLLNVVEGEDSRSKYRFEITAKGTYLAKYMTEILEYVNSGEEQDIKDVPPVFFMRKAIAEKGFDLTRPIIIPSLPDFSTVTEDREEYFSEARKNPSGFYCPECNKRVFSKSGLKIHVSRMHKKQREELHELIEHLYP